MMEYPWRNAALPTYVLLDPTADDKLARWLTAFAGEQQWLFDGLGLPREASPVLLTLDDNMPVARLQQLLTMSHHVPAVVWLWSALSAEQLAAHLASMIQPETSLGKIVFRYYDPRLLSRLPDILTTEQWQLLCAPVSSLACMDAEQQWFEWSVPTGQIAADAAWELEDAQLDACANWGLAWQVWMGMPSPQARNVDVIYQALGRAHALGLTTQGDLQCFAELACAFHPEFDQDAEVAPHLAGIAHGVALEEALQQVPATVWSRLEQASAA
ncbi:hypothetical protein C2134_15805 [Chromobacterium sinusclupearum]|uniref:DUF4123 domain-containing protein n=1 Tax=Chromobacterium sinusclupearum TaxID=2077146 RepID=A0A2K4MJR0_9NEIS|nr:MULTISPECIES: DUF4123 domain-containing protein [Chromobacterium]POA97308.1 hypothetical protein C2134_15805 [Chromobacterium sinusclupearum]